MNTSFFNKILSQNAFFFIGFVLFLLLSTIGLLTLEQGELVLYFSKHRTPFSDQFFSIITQFAEEIAILVAIVGFLFYKYRYSISVTLLSLSVMVVSAVTKSIFAHPRPLAYFRSLGMEDQLTFVANVRVNEGVTSFPSGHTMAGFALFCFVALAFSGKRIVGVICLLVAIAIGISRIYLVQHFLKDVYLGSIIGVSLAVIWFLLQAGWKRPWLDSRLFKQKKV